MSSETKKNVVTLKTLDGKTFEVEIDVISQSQRIKHMIRDECADEFIPVRNVDSKVLSKVIEYCQKHYKSASFENVVDEKTKDEIGTWDIEFMNSMNMGSWIDLILAANYLEIKSLLDLTAQKIAHDIEVKTLEEIREIFNIKRDFTPEEEEELKNKHGWIVGQ